MDSWVFEEGFVTLSSNRNIQVENEKKHTS